MSGGEERIFETLTIELGLKVMDSWDAWNPAASDDGEIRVVTRAGIADLLEKHRRTYGTSRGSPPSVQSTHYTDVPINGQCSCGFSTHLRDLPRPCVF